MALKELDAELQKTYGDAYYGILIYGSRALGYGTASSDADIKIVVDLKKINQNIGNIRLAIIQKIEQILNEKMHIRPDATIIDFNENKASDYIKNSSVEDAADYAALFSALSVGKRINNIRKHIVEEISRRPDSYKVWSLAQQYFKETVLFPWSSLSGIKFRAFLTKRSQGESHNISDTLYDRQRSLGLPPLDKTKEILERHLRKKTSRPKP